MEVERAYISFSERERVVGPRKIHLPREDSETGLWTEFVKAKRRTRNRKHKKTGLPESHILSMDVLSIGDTFYWHLNGIIHREHDFPAVISGSGDRKFYKYGVLFREVCKHSQRARPAVIGYDGTKEYHGRETVRLREKERTALKVSPRGIAVLRAGASGTLEITASGVRMYRNSAGRFHNTVGPAITGPGTRVYMRNGKGSRPEREGPAIEHFLADESKYVRKYMKDGQVSRTKDRPAILKGDGYKEYYENGRKICRPFRASTIDPAGVVSFYNDDNELSRLQYPARLSKDGVLEFAMYGIVIRNYDPRKDELVSGAFDA